jgi:hypothetical protein
VVVEQPGVAPVRKTHQPGAERRDAETKQQMRYDTANRNQAATAASLAAAAYPPTGQYCPPYARGTDVVVPGCGKPVKPICDVGMVANVVRNTLAGAIGTLTMAPVRTNYFQPLSEALIPVDTATPDLNRRVEVQAIEINNIPQEAFSNGPVVGSTSAALSDFFGTKFDGYGKPISYGIYSQAALIQVFTYGFVNIEATATDVYGIHFGNPLDILPPGYTAGTPFV